MVGGVVKQQKYDRQATQRRIRPLLVVGYEGETEKRYCVQLAKRYGFTVHPTGPENRWTHLLERVVIEAKKLSKQQSRRPIVPIIIVDIEVMSDKKIAEAIEFADTAKRQGVEVFINRPKIEQWFVLHALAISENSSPAEVDRHLSRLPAELGVPKYKKPGSIHFHQALMDYTENATRNCNSTGHSRDGLSCVCELIRLLVNHSPIL